MLGNENLGVHSFGAGDISNGELNCASIFIKENKYNFNIKIAISIDLAVINIEPLSTTISIKNKFVTTCESININSFPVQIFTTKLTPNINQYIDYTKTNIRTPIYKVELLRKYDESVYKTINGEIVCDSGSVVNTLDEGVRRTCNFTIPNYSNQYGDFVNNIHIGDKFKLYLGYKIDNIDKYFPQGVFVFDDPSMLSEIANKEIELAGTDKWSMLNGQNGGILEGTYVVKSGAKIGELIRSILKLNIVGDPIEPSIDKDIENMTTTYDITKNAGDTISDVLLEVALNISAYIFYDENGRLQVYPVDNDMFKSPSCVLNKNEYNYLGGTKQYQLSQIYNSVLVIGENIQNSETPIIYEALNNDLTDPNSIPNVGFKKVKKITEYTKGIDTVDLAKARASWELKKVKAKISSVDVNCLSLYHLDVNQIVVLTDFYLNAKDERFLINSIDLPIGIDIQSTINLVKAVEIE